MDGETAHGGFPDQDSARSDANTSPSVRHISTKFGLLKYVTVTTPASDSEADPRRITSSGWLPDSSVAREWTRTSRIAHVWLRQDVAARQSKVGVVGLRESTPSKQSSLQV